MAESEKIETTDAGFKYIRFPSGKLYSFYDAVHGADVAETAFARAISRAFKLIPDWTGEQDRASYREMDYERIEWALDSMEACLRAVREYLDKQRGIKKVEERIALMRNTAGRTPEEAAEFRRKADQLESKLKGN